jgi:hypothetical protein
MREEIMATQTALERVEQESQPASLMTVIERLASNPNVDIDKLRQLLEMQERWETNRDKSALRHAMAEFKANPPAILKERTAKMVKDGKLLYTYKYADLEDVTSAIEGELGKKGVTFAWPQKEDAAGISITCIMRYGMYEEPGVTMSSPPDASGGKNAIQARASTVTYLRRYTLLGAVGMAAGMPDTDGAPPEGGLEEDAVAAQIKRLEACSTLVDLQKAFEEAYKAAGDFIRARDKRKQEIRSSPPASPQRIADPLVVERLNWIEDAKDIKELQRIYDNALKMARAHGDTDFEARLLAAANKRAEAIRNG